MTQTQKMTARESRGRARHSEFLMMASMTLRGYGYPELGDEIAGLAQRIRDGELTFDVDAAVD